MITILAEKPSVAREIARIAGATRKEEGFYTGNGYHVTWALGHLVQPALPDGYGFKGFSRDSLPVIPEVFLLIPRQVKTDKGYKADAAAVKQIKVITKLWQESEGIIVATDCAREGELIFRYLYAYTGCTLPFRRLWISSLTDTAIRKGLKELKDGHEYDDLYLAAKARSEADWLVGINGTQALTVAAGRGTYSVGRVQTPALGMVCKRYWENRRFTPEPVHQLHFSVTPTDTDTVVKFSSVKKWQDKEEAAALYYKVKAKMCATVTKVEKKEKVENPPLLYDLTTLQKEANTKHGFTAEQTLELVQKLYEAKLVTYPRTSSRHIPEDVFAEIPLLAKMCATVTKVEKKEKVENPPLLYDLTTLQKEANTKHGFTAEQTLELVQKLYEAKLVTYPRTSSRHIPEDVFAEIPLLFERLAGHSALADRNSMKRSSSPIREHRAAIFRKMCLLKYRCCLNGWQDTPPLRRKSGNWEN